MVRGTNGHQYMIDSGTTAGRTGKQLLNQMEKDGLEVKNTKGIFITHAHPDHIAGISFFRNLIGNIPVYCNELDFDALRDPKYLENTLLDELGPLRNDVSKMPTPLVNLGFNYLYGKQKPINNLIAVSEGDRFNLNAGGSVYLEVVNTAGHVPAHMGYLLKMGDGKNAFFSGDLVSFKEGNDGDLVALASLNNPLSSYTGELSTLDKLSSMDIDYLFTGHYGTYEGREMIKEFMREAHGRIQEFEKKLLRYLEEGPKRVPDITDHVITMKNYLSGYATRPSTIYAILKHLEGDHKVKLNIETREFSVI